MGINRLTGQNCISIKFRNPDRLMRAGDELQANVVCTIASAIRIRGVYCVMYGYEQTCTKKVREPNANNAARRTIIKEEVLVWGDENKLDVLSPGEYSWPVRFVIPLDLPSSFTLADQNKFTGVFYELSAWMQTVTKLRTRFGYPFRLEGAIKMEKSLEHAVVITRRAARTFWTGGSIKLQASLERSAVVAGDPVGIEVEIENKSGKKIDAVKVTIKEQVFLQGSTAKKSYTGSRRAYYARFDDCKSSPAPGVFKGRLEIRIPETLPSTQSTPHGLIGIEYHLNVRLDLSWKADLRVRIPLLIFQRSQFPDERELARRASLTSRAADAPAESEGSGQQPVSFRTADDDEAQPLMEEVPASPGRDGDGDGGGDDAEEDEFSRAQRQQYGDLARLFAKYDANCDGIIDKSEFNGLHKALVDNKVTEKPPHTVWDEMDANSDGHISLNEFVDFLLREGALKVQDVASSSGGGGGGGGGGDDDEEAEFRREQYPYVLTQEDRELYGDVLRGHGTGGVRSEYERIGLIPPAAKSLERRNSFPPQVRLVDAVAESKK